MDSFELVDLSLSDALPPGVVASHGSVDLPPLCSYGTAPKVDESGLSKELDDESSKSDWTNLLDEALCLIDQQEPVERDNNFVMKVARLVIQKESCRKFTKTDYDASSLDERKPLALHPDEAARLLRKKIIHAHYQRSKRVPSTTKQESTVQTAHPTQQCGYTMDIRDKRSTSSTKQEEFRPMGLPKPAVAERPYSGVGSNSNKNDSAPETNSYLQSQDNPTKKERESEAKMATSTKVASVVSRKRSLPNAEPGEVLSLDEFGLSKELDTENPKSDWTNLLDEALRLIDQQEPAERDNKSVMKVARLVIKKETGRKFTKLDYDASSLDKRKPLALHPDEAARLLRKKIIHAHYQRSKKAASTTKQESTVQTAHPTQQHGGYTTDILHNHSTSSTDQAGFRPMGLLKPRAVAHPYSEVGNNSRKNDSVSNSYLQSQENPAKKVRESKNGHQYQAATVVSRKRSLPNAEPGEVLS